MEEIISFKNNLKDFCLQAIEQRIAAARQMILQAQEAANSEEKSSAGDKYETGRAMGHLQKDMHARQLSACLLELTGLQKINTNVICSAASAGAFVETAGASFFIAAGLGKQLFDGKEIFFLSPGAPLAAGMQHKKKGDSFVFNRSPLIITAVF